MFLSKIILYENIEADMATNIIMAVIGDMKNDKKMTGQQTKMNIRQKTQKLAYISESGQSTASERVPVQD